MQEIAELRTRLKNVNVEYSTLLRQSRAALKPVTLDVLRQERHSLMRVSPSCERVKAQKSFGWPRKRRKHRRRSWWQPGVPQHCCNAAERDGRRQ